MTGWLLGAGLKRAEFIHVGTELLGFRHNTHTIYLAQKLAPLGFRAARACIVADDQDEIARSITESLARSSLVVVTGGLGPTFDDLTREGAAKALDLGLERGSEILEKIEERFRRVGMVMPTNNERQAYVLSGARILDNQAGTAPGQVVEAGGGMLILLPGPPREMSCTLDEALKIVRKKFPGSGILARSCRIAGLSESGAEEVARPLLQSLSKDSVESTILASSYIIDFIFQAKGPQAERTLEMILGDMRSLFGVDYLGEDGATLEGAVGGLLSVRKETLAVAESCTGGLIADKITNVPGSSAYFLGGVVAYADVIKERDLGVPAQTLRDHGAVSGETALEMAEGLRRKMSSDWALSVTGICGPSGESPEKPLGLAYFGLSRRDATVRIEKRIFFGDRMLAKEKMAFFALDFLRRALFDTRHPALSTQR